MGRASDRCLAGRAAPHLPALAAPRMPAVGELLNSGTARLRAAGSDSARLDAELLLGLAIGADRTTLIAHSDAPVGADAAAIYERGLVRREAGEPVAYIRGLKEFYGLAFSVDSRGLIPRPETELLVAEAEAEVAWRLVSAPRPAGTPKLRVVDVGTGSGAIAIALAATLRKRRMLPEVSILAVDRGGAVFFDKGGQLSKRDIVPIRSRHRDLPNSVDALPKLRLPAHREIE